MYKDYYQYEKVEGFERKLIETIPEEAYTDSQTKPSFEITENIIKVKCFSLKVE